MKVSVAADVDGQVSAYTQSLGFAVLSFGSVALITLLGTVLTSRILGVHIVGEFALVYVPTGAVAFLSTVREQAALVRELASLEPRNSRVTALFVAVLAFSSGLTALVTVIAVPLCYVLYHGPFAAPGLFVPAVATLAGYTLITNPGWNVDAVFSAFVAGRQLFWIRLHQAVVSAAVGVTLGLLWHSVWALVISTAAAAATSLVHRAIAIRSLMRWRIAREELLSGFSALPDLLRFGIRAAPGSVLQGVSNQIGTLVLGTVGSVATVGAYSRALTAGRQLYWLPIRITEMLLPVLVRRRDDVDTAGFDRAVVDTQRVCTTSLLLPAAAVGGAANSVMEVFGPGFTRGAAALALLMLLPVTGGLSAIQSYTLFAVDRPLVTTKIAMYATGVTVALTVGLAARFGSTGVAAAAVTGTLVDNALKVVQIRPHLSGSWRELWPRRQRAALLLAYAAGFAAAHLVERDLRFPGNLAPSLVAGATAYAVTLLLCGGLAPADRRRLRVLGAAIRRRRLRPRPG